MPRWLYLLLKPVETIAVGVLLERLFGFGSRPAAALALTLYVGVGLFLWYRSRPITLASLAPGGFVGDSVYHALCSAPALVVWLPIPLWIRWVAITGLLALWWTLDTAGYGPMRAP